jgi:hypothetical protein
MVWLLAIVVSVLLVVSQDFRKITIGLVVLLAIGAGIYSVWNTYNNRPMVVEELSGVRLGMSPVDVKLAKGAPRTEEQVPTEGRYPLRWVFGTHDLNPLIVYFTGIDEDTLRVAVVCDGRNGRLLGLGSFSSEEAVVARLGAATNTSIAEDALSKIVTFEPYKVAFKIAKGMVTEVCVIESGSLSYGKAYKGG